MPFIISQGISSAETFQDPNSTQYKVLLCLWISRNSVLSESDTPTTDKKTLIDKNLYGLLMLYYDNIESVSAQHSIQGTMYEQSSDPSQENYFDPNLLDDFRTASDNSGIQFLTTNAAESTQQQWFSTAVHHDMVTSVTLTKT
jgi:hypothetical protein